MLRHALVALALTLAATACKKADSKDVGPSTTASGDGRVAVDPTGKGSAPEAGSASGTDTDTGDVKGSGTAQPADPKVVPKGSGTAKVEGGGDTKGTDTSSGDTSYQLTISSPDPVSAGGAATAKLTVKPGKGYKMNKDFPTKLTIEPPAGVTLAKTTFEGEDAETFDEKQLVFAVDCTVGASGTYNVEGKLKFAVCTDTTCDPKRQAISFAVAAK